MQNNMKKLLVLATAITFGFATFAQNAPKKEEKKEAKKEMKHEEKKEMKKEEKKEHKEHKEAAPKK
jgi:Ni/Co efflux regulator RcnB